MDQKNQKFTIRVETGKPDSLMKTVNIFYTLTPVGLTESTSYSPARLGWQTFEIGAAKIVHLSWTKSALVWTCELGDRRLGVLKDTRWLHMGNSVQMSSLADGKMSLSQETKQPVTTLTVTNNTPSAQNLCLTLTKVDGDSYKPIIFYDALQPSKSTISSLDLVLQVYVVDAPKVVAEILRPEDLTRPIFTAPISCGTLPAASIWKLCQDHSGKIKLINDNDPGLGQTSAESSIGDIYNQLSLVLKTLDTTQQRLAKFEQELSDSRVQLSTTQKELADARGKLDLLDRAVPIVEAKTAELEVSIARTETRAALVGESASAAQLATVEKVLAMTNNALLAVQESSVTTRNQLSALNEKVPVMEGKLSDMKAAFGKSEKRLSSVDSTLSDLADRRIQQLEAKSNHLENSYSLDKLSTIQKSVDLTRDHLSTLDRRVLSVEAKADDALSRTSGRLSRVGSPSSASDPAATLQERVPGLDRGVPAVEARVDEMERSFAETKKDVSFMRKLLRTKFPTLESRADALEKSVARVQEDVSAIQASLVSTEERQAGLELRMIAVEEKSDRLVDLQHQSQVGVPRNQSPLLFPSQSHTSRLSTPSPSQEAAFYNRQDSDSDVGQ